MIPLILKINNFLSYGNQTQTINFAPYKLICLSGKNGHGKSALLDALTWVLWGQARKVSTTSKPDQGLVHLGQVEMMVSLDFIFNNQKYRVKRDFSQKYGKPNTHVEFGMLDTDTDRFISLTDKTIRKTDEKIIQTIGLDFDTFINTCFLRQGQSNEFSRKSAKERKEILSTILGLSHYDHTRKFILESARELQQKAAQHDHIQERIVKEIESLQLQIADHEALEIELTGLEQEQKITIAKSEELSKSKENLIQKEEYYKLLLEQHATAQTQKKELVTRMHQEIIAWRAAHKIICGYAYKDTQIAQKKALEEQCTVVQKQLHTQLASKEQLLQTKEKIQKEETLLHNEFQVQKEGIQKTIIESESSLQVVSKQEKEYASIVKTQEEDLARISKQISELLLNIPSSYLVCSDQEALIIFERHKALYRSWIERANRCKQEITENHHKEELSNDPENPSCQLCEQNLSQSRKRFLQKKLHDSQHALTRRFNRLKDSIVRLKEYVQKEYSYIQLLEQKKKLEEQQAIIMQDKERNSQTHTELHKQRTTLMEQVEEHTKTLKELVTTYTIEYKKNPILQPLYTQLAEQQQAASLYDTTLSHYETLQKKLADVLLLTDDNAQETYKQEQEKRYATIMQLKKDRNHLNIILQQTLPALSLSQELAQHKQVLEKEIATTHQQNMLLTGKKQELLEKKAIIAHALEKKKTLEKEQITIEEEKKKITIQYLQEQSLAQAFSKDGIQALLIEEALPELEYEANDLLSRLTDNQAHISIESLRDLKKGGTRETLDINISDAQGVRPYELFSGGEAFRIDFALRIAISKLLARRAGTSLQTLIIDEGFGSQDDEGLQRIMDALYTIQDDFEKIIIVSHLSTMKEQFPVHFVVNKKPNGSVVTVFEND